MEHAAMGSGEAAAIVAFKRLSDGLQDMQEMVGL